MTGYRLHIDIAEMPEDIRFRLYDNGERVVDNIGEFDFSYLVDSNYTGVHQLTMTYFQTFDEDNESAPKTIFTKDFTLPTLEYSVDVSLLS